MGARFRRGFMLVRAGIVGDGLGNAFLLVSAVENAHCPPWGWQALGAGLDSAHRSATMLWWAFAIASLARECVGEISDRSEC